MAKRSMKDAVAETIPAPGEGGGEATPEPAVNPDAALMVGGPQETGAVPELEEVEIGGKKFRVLKEQVGDVSELFKTTSDRLVESERALTELRAGTPQPVTPIVEGDKPEDIGTLLFTDPAKAVAAIKQEIVREVAGMYTAEESRKGFWTDFYKDHPDLEDSDLMVRAIAGKNFSTLGPMKASAAGNELADLTRKEILRMVNKSKGGNSGSDRSTSLEGTRALSAPAAPEEHKGPQSLSATIKARAAVRRKASTLKLAE